MYVLVGIEFIHNTIEVRREVHTSSLLDLVDGQPFHCSRLCRLISRSCVTESVKTLKGDD